MLDCRLQLWARRLEVAVCHLFGCAATEGSVLRRPTLVCRSSLWDTRDGNLPALFRPGPSRRGICLITVSEATKAAYFLAAGRCGACLSLGRTAAGVHKVQVASSRGAVGARCLGCSAAGRGSKCLQRVGGKHDGWGALPG